MDRIRRNEADMHMHSNQSDGRNTVNELFSLVKKFKIKAAVLTDHDRVKGLKKFIFFCRNNGIDSMTGIEISSTDTVSHPQTIDVLGYGFNTETLLRYYNNILEHNLNVRIKYIKKVLDIYRKKRVMDFTVESLKAHFNLPVEVANKYWLIAARMENLNEKAGRNPAFFIGLILPFQINQRQFVLFGFKVGDLEVVGTAHFQLLLHLGFCFESGNMD